jgi:hypothetical protein
MRWMPRADLFGALTAVVLLACGGPSNPGRVTLPSPEPAGDRLAVADEASNLVDAALQADARLEPADSLYSQSVVSIADGHYRDAPPRFAALEAGGTLAVGNMQVVVKDSVVWAVVEYRWFSARDDVARQALATVILVRPTATTGWKIVQTHSSTAR